jgi:hypothetical protein
LSYLSLSLYDIQSLCARGGRGSPLLCSVREPTLKGRLLLSCKRRLRCLAMIDRGHRHTDIRTHSHTGRVKSSYKPALRN